ncbi:RNA-directed DNA polymerase, eukaryota, reverse transcriptase zinc-binding domain protein, partial [Tanacetum coccineum]
EGLPRDLPNRAKTFQDIGVHDRKISIDLAQKSKVKRAIEGDENSIFFHGIVNMKIRQQAIKGILVDGKLTDNPDRIVSWCTSRKEQALLFKVDFQKAFESVRWDHLDDILGKFSFDGKWQGCLLQGDPISPFLFILVIESLHVAFHRVIDRGMFVPILVGKNDLVPISHLFYDDDDIFIGKWSSSNERVDDDVALVLSCVRFEMVAYMARMNSWNEVIQKVTIKFSKWKAKSLSVGGRLTLLKSVLGSLPTYYMSLFKAPDGVLSHFERLHKSFFLGAEMDERLWLNVIKAIHGSIGSLDQPPPTYTGCSIWILIHKAVFSLYAKGVDLLRFFNLDLQKDASVAQKFQNPNFSVYFRRRPRGGIEESQFQELSSFLSSVVLSSSGDCWSWTLNSQGNFLVQLAREEIDKHLLVTSSSFRRWSKFLPIKLNGFAWRMFLVKLPTRINLSNRGLDIPCVLCPNCENAVELRNHLFFGCSMALDLFRLLGRWWNIDFINLIDPFLGNRGLMVFGLTASKSLPWKPRSSSCGGIYRSTGMWFCSL